MITVAKRLSAKLLIVVIGKAWQSGHGGHCAFKRRLWGKPQEGYLGHLQIVGDSKAEMVFWPSPHLGATKGQRASSLDPMSPGIILTTELENVAG